jgi:dienelactone hydrolase
MTHRFRLIIGMAASLLSGSAMAQWGAPLPNTASVPFEEEDLSARVMDGAHRFVDAQIRNAIQKREQALTNVTDAESLSRLRERLHQILGLADDRVAPHAFEKFGSGATPGLVTETEGFRVWQVRWQVLESYWAEGLLVEPAKASARQNIAWIALPDADETPEQILGIGSAAPAHHQHLISLARAGITVVVPTLINRQPFVGANGKPSDQSHRERLYRPAFQMGRHLLAYEVQAVQAAADLLLQSNPDQSLWCSGYGEGGLVALLTTAADKRFHGCVTSGYLGEETPFWEQPLFRNLHSFERDVGVSGLIRLQEGRPLLIHAVNGPEYTDSKGQLRPNVDISSIEELLASQPPPTREAAKVIKTPQLHAADLASVIPSLPETATGPEPSKEERPNFDPFARHQRVFKGIENTVQQRIRDAEQLRDQNFAYQLEPALKPGLWSTRRSHPTLDPEKFIETAKAFRQKFSREAIGEFDAPYLPLNPRSRQILDEESWTAWDVVLDVYPDLMAWGMLILPKDIKPGERRPVIVVQHGLNGLPRDWINPEKTAYSQAGIEFAKRGFVVFSPHNLYRGDDRFRQLDRKAKTIGASLFSFIIPSHHQILAWLKTLPQVNPERIAFYGLSYGGKSAMRIPAVLEDYSAVICSGDFNQWTRKVADISYPHGYMNTKEWEIYDWNLGQTFDYAEMASLIFPRPFMVERGHHDLVGTDSWVAYEYARVRYLYAQFGRSERTEIEFFQGGHSVNDQNTFRFLHRHLQWPEPR